MLEITWRGELVQIHGNLPSVGEVAPPFVLVGADLVDISDSFFRGSTLVLNVFPSIDTPTCAKSVRRFNEELASLENCYVLCVSADLPYAQARFCGAEGLDRVLTGSTFRSTFSEDYGLTVMTGIRRGLAARAVLVINPEGVVDHVELVSEVSTEPDYRAALSII